MMADQGLTWEQVDRFVTDGFVRVEGAFPAAVATACRDLLWVETGCDPDDPATWTRPVVRIGGMSQQPFRDAANTARLHAAFDQLVGSGRWLPPGGLGTFPIRFPSRDEPGDDGWHVEASFADATGALRLNLHSRGRALLMLFLLSDVGPDDAPTRVRTGSHLDVAPLLQRYGDDGAEFFAFAGEAVTATEHRPVNYATGAAGDVYLVHPFVVHAAQPHRGERVKFMAQPPLHPKAALDLDRADGDHSPVEFAVLSGLGSG